MVSTPPVNIRKSEGRTDVNRKVEMRTAFVKHSVERMFSILM
jgi:hypothetical protein